MILIPFVILNIQNDSDKAFMCQLYIDHHRLMYHAARTVAHEDGLLDDIVSDACITLIGKIDLLRQMNENQRRSYVFTCTRHAALQYLRQEKRQQVNLEMQNLMIDECEDEQPSADSLIFEEYIRALIDSVERLSHRDRELLFMRYFEDLSDDEMAAVLNIKPDSVRVLLMRARRRALKMMKEIMDDGN